MPNLFPDIEPSDYSWEPASRSIVLDLANGSRQVTETSPRLQRVFTLRYAIEDAAALWQQLFPHFEANRSRAFPLFDFWRIPWVTPLRFATGNGTQRTFSIPAKDIDGLAVKVGSTSPVFTRAVGAGPDGEDQITFAIPDTPAINAALTWSAALARRKFPVWYYGGPNTPPTFKPIPVDGGLWGLDLQLIEEVTLPW